jgi:hypothetical protein
LWPIHGIAIARLNSRMQVSIEDEYPAEATVGDQSQREDIGKLDRPFAVASLSPPELRQLISQAAYQLYLSRGKGDGYDLDDWLAAERLVLHPVAEIRLALREQTHGEEI